MEVSVDCTNFKNGHLFGFAEKAFVHKNLKFVLATQRRIAGETSASSSAQSISTLPASTSIRTARPCCECSMKKSAHFSSNTGSVVSSSSCEINSNAPNCRLSKASSRALEKWPACVGTQHTFRPGLVYMATHTVAMVTAVIF